MSVRTVRDGTYPFPKTMQKQMIETRGANIHVRSGGQGPAVVLLHGFGTTGDMWGLLAERLIANHTVIVPDLRGMGFSSKPEDGYDKKTQALDILAVLDALGVGAADFVTHDIGDMVAYAFAAMYPERTKKWVMMDAALPGIGPWDQILQRPAMWHFGFGGPDMERLVSGRERIYLDRFWNEFSRDPQRFDEEKRQHYSALYALPGAMRASFKQFSSFSKDAIDNKGFLAQGKLQIPILAVGGEAASGRMVGAIMRLVAKDVEDAVISDSGHWVMEEQPETTAELILDFLHKHS